MTFRSFLAVAAALAAFSVPAIPAIPITPVAGTFSYTQNFDSLYMATISGEQVASPAWSDNVTLPGWYFYRAGQTTTPVGLAGAGFLYYGHNGAANSTGKYLSMGQPNNSDRALGAVPITAQGEMSVIVIFQNNSGRAVDLSRMAYNIEVLRENQNAGNKETLFVWWKKAATEAALTTNTVDLVANATSVFVTGTNCSTPSSSYITGWNRFLNAGGTPDYEWTYTSPNGVATTATTTINVTQAVDASPTTAPRLNAGEFLAIRWSNINDGGADAVMGIDDLTVTFQELDAGIAPVVTPTRNPAGTARDPSDDSVNLSIIVNGSGAVGPGWRITAPPSLAGTTGNYGTGAGTPVVVNNLPLTEFAGPNHSMSITFEDQLTASVTRNVSVNAPWCSLVPSLTNAVYHDGGTPGNPADDTVDYQVSVDGLYTGASYTVDGQTIPYGGSHAVLGVAAGSLQQFTFVDSADANCTVTFPVIAPAIIGTKSTSGSPQNLLSAPNHDATAVAWAINSTTKVVSMNNGSANGLALKSFRSEVLNLASVSGAVQFSATVTAVDSSSGFEANEDFFRAELLLSDGVATSTVNLTAAYDTDSSGFMQGTEIVGALTTATYNLAHLIPDNIVSAQLVVTGMASSTSETIRVSAIDFTPAARLEAVPGAVTVNNHGTAVAADDEFSAPVTITPIDLGASTGWTAVPAAPPSGLYTDPNPVTFGPFLISGGPVNVTLTNVPNNAYTAQFTLTPPAPILTATGVTNIVEHENGPGFADDTVSFDVTVAGQHGGPGWSAAGATPGTGAFGVVNVTVAIPVGATSVPVAIADASYPAATATVNVPVTPRYLFGTVNLPGLTQDIVTAPGAAPSARWTNDAAARTLRQLSPTATDTGVVASAPINLAGVAGVKHFSCTLEAAILTGAGSSFESPDTWKVELALTEGGIETVLNLIQGSAADKDANGVLNGSGTSAADYVALGDEFNSDGLVRGAAFTHEFTFTHNIPAAVESVRVIITGFNNSPQEQYIVRNVSITAAGGSGDSDGDGVSDAAEAAAGTDPNDPASFLRITAYSPTPGAPNSMRLTFPTVTGRDYKVYASADLQNWTALGTVRDGTNADISVDVAPTPAPGSGKLFFRIMVGPDGFAFP